MTDAPKPPPVPRLRTNADRDFARPKTPPPGVPVEIRGDITGVFVGEELKVARSRRSTPDRIVRLEDKADVSDEWRKNHDKKVDDLAREVSDVKVGVAGIKTKLDTWYDLRDELQPQPQIETIQRVVQDTTTTTLATRLLDEQTATIKFRRTFTLSVVKVIGLIAGGAAGGEIAHYLAGKL